MPAPAQPRPAESWPNLETRLLVAVCMIHARYPPATTTRVIEVSGVGKIVSAADRSEQITDALDRLAAAGLLVKERAAVLGWQWVPTVALVRHREPPAVDDREAAITLARSRARWWGCPHPPVSRRGRLCLLCLDELPELPGVAVLRER